MPGCPCCFLTLTCYGPPPSSERCPSFPDFGAPQGAGPAACRAALGAVHSAPTICVLEAGRATVSALETLEMPPETSLLHLDPPRRGWATAVFIFVESKPQISEGMFTRTDMAQVSEGKCSAPRGQPGTAGRPASSRRGTKRCFCTGSTPERHAVCSAANSAAPRPRSSRPSRAPHFLPCPLPACSPFLTRTRWKLH